MRLSAFRRAKAVRRDQQDFRDEYDVALILSIL